MQWQRCYRQALEAEHKLAKDDVHRITMELQERRARVDKLEAKFNVVSTKKHSLYEEEEPKSQAYYVIKAAQERQELQQRGDMLDADNHRLQDEVCPLGCSVRWATVMAAISAWTRARSEDVISMGWTEHICGTSTVNQIAFAIAWRMSGTGSETNGSEKQISEPRSHGR